MILLLGALTAFPAMAMDMYLPSLPTIAKSFAVSADEAARTVSVFFIGLAAGQFVYGPLSDRFGRRPPILFGIALYVAASGICAFSPSIEMLTAARLAQALGGCAGMVVSRAVVRDSYDHRETARIFSLLMLVMGTAPILAPLLGGFVLSVAGWRTIFYILTGFGAMVGIAAVLALPETRPETVAALARTESPVAAYAALLRQRRIVGYALTGALNGASFFTYISASPDLVINTYGIPAEHFGWVFGANAAGFIGATQINRALLKHYSPDEVLSVASLVALGFAGLLALGAMSGIGGAAGVLAPLFLLIATNGFMGANTTAGALGVDPARAGSVSALVGGAAFGIGAAASAVASAFHDGTPVPMALVMLVASAGATTALFTLARVRP